MGYPALGLPRLRGGQPSTWQKRVLSAGYLVFWRVRYYPPGPVPGWVSGRVASPVPRFFLFCILLFHPPPPPFSRSFATRGRRHRRRASIAARASGAGPAGSYSPSRSLSIRAPPQPNFGAADYSNNFAGGRCCIRVFHATSRTRRPQNFFVPLLQEGFPQEHEKHHWREPIALSHNLS